MTDTVTVKPCPFCGGEASLRDDSCHSTAFYIGCQTLGCFGHEQWDETMQEALDNWNTRAPQTPAQAAREPTRDDGTPDVGPPVFVMYTNYRGETARREISPVGIWFGSTDWHPKNGWLLHCYDWGKKDWRDYELLSCDFRAIAGGE